jgi:hypothetical protein
MMVLCFLGFIQEKKKKKKQTNKQTKKKGYERNSLRSVCKTDPGKVTSICLCFLVTDSICLEVRVHRVGTPDSYDFDVAEAQAPPIRPLARGRRVALAYVADLENTNEWPNSADYLLVGEGLEEDEEVDEHGEKKNKRVAPSLSRIRGDFGLKRVKTEEPVQAAATIIQVAPVVFCVVFLSNLFFLV